MKFQDFRIKTKLLLLIAMMSLVTAGIAGFGVTKITFLNQSLKTVDTVDSAATLGARMNQNTIIMNRSEYRVAADPSPETIKAAREVADKNIKQFKERLAKSAETADADEKAQLGNIEAEYTRYLTELNKTYQLAERASGQVSLTDAQRAVVDQVKASRARADKLQAAVKAYVDHVDDRGTKTANDAKAQGNAAIMIMIAVAISGIVFGIITGMLLANFGISIPLNRSVDELRKLADGRLDTLVTGADRGDECGDIAKGLAVFRDNAVRARDLEAEAVNQKQLAEVNRKKMMLQLADDFEKSVGAIVSLVSSAATEMQASATQLSATAQEASAQSVAVSAAAEEAGANVTSVASSAEELGASVSEIGRQVERSSQISNEAVKEASRVASVVTELNTVASSIGSVVEMINTIAGQTNLLALNATIESARAGEAGKGFAVVASEVKQLAGQTSKATTDISEKIALIQDATTRAVSAIEGISNTIADINNTSTVIASAVEQQGAATREIVQAVTQASIGTSEVTSNITGVAQAAEETGDAASQVLSASSELAGQAERLHREMDKFLTTVRAA
ncbi:methyl-accepting chemotaxis protein [Asticcacaulis sp. 201]|uniref:methyl-accepting chemotaxis protein n=1 Tax=Asticcacaulis sp. 201 TaxID=3028787 RepID=UPI0029170EB6|nr:methyl-accepting chemotaxis protein [Asticcacaulis sp. 201]MDV6329536.1 methyl-accepting chemotaxis protein [Asticcacaulis sp. 201]